MKVAIVKTTIDRKTGNVISKEIAGYKEVDEDEYYRPLVEILYKDFHEKFMKSKNSETQKKEIS